MALFGRPCNGPLTSYYGYRVHPVTGQRNKMHYGLDYGNTPADNRIFAAADGTVKKIAYMAGGYGWYIILRHVIKGQAYETVYAHLRSTSVKVGQTVKRGQTIAIKGNTGIGTGVHLHFEVHLGRWTGNMINTRNPALYVYDEGTFEIQGRLKMLGFNIQADGHYGKGTENAVRVFQRREGLVVDGFAGYNTKLRLRNKTPKYSAETAKKEQDKAQQNNKEKVEKEMREVFNAGTSTLNSAAKRMIEEAVADGILKSDEWVKKYDTGKITTAEVLGLAIVIQERRDQLLKISSGALKNETKAYLEEALEDEVLSSDDWLKALDEGTMTVSDLIALKISVDERRKKRAEAPKKEVTETKEDKK